MSAAADHGAAAPSLWRSIRAVGWSFLGVRKKSEFQQDLARVNPLHVMAVGFAAVAVLVAGLMALVHWVAG